MSPQDHDFIVRNIVVATINEGIAKQRIALCKKTGKAVDLIFDQTVCTYEDPTVRYSFTYAERDLYVSLADDNHNGVIIAVVLLAPGKDSADCSVVIGRLCPSRSYDHPAILVVKHGRFSCNGDVPSHLLETNEAHANGFGLVMQQN